MFSFSLAEGFIALFIGMGPIKVLLVYMAKTANMDQATRRAMARRIVIVAGSVGVGMFALGALLQQVLHQHHRERCIQVVLTSCGDAFVS